MRKSWRVLVLLALAGGACLLSPGRGDEPSKTATKELMQKKLKQSQKVLEGIALNDFDKIADGGDQLIAISQAAEWHVVKSPQYDLFSNQFKRNAESLIKNAKAKNLDGAALDYFDLTLTCVKCHKYVREERMTRRDAEPAPEALFSVPVK